MFSFLIYFSPGELMIKNFGVEGGFFELRDTGTQYKGLNRFLFHCAL